MLFCDVFIVNGVVQKCSANGHRSLSTLSLTASIHNQEVCLLSDLFKPWKYVMKPVVVVVVVVVVLINGSTCGGSSSNSG